MKGPLGNKVYIENPALPPRKPTPIQLPTKKHGKFSISVVLSKIVIK
jgi:hypothetical protein